MSIKHSLSLSLLLSSYASRTYSVTGRVAISLIHETTRAKRRRSIIFIFLPTAHSAWFVRGPNETLPSYSLYPLPPPLPHRLFSRLKYRCRRRVHPKKERGGLGVPGGQRIKMRRAAQPCPPPYPFPAWKRLVSRPRNGRRRGQFLFTRPRPVEFKRAVPLIFLGEGGRGKNDKNGTARWSPRPRRGWVHLPRSSRPEELRRWLKRWRWWDDMRWCFGSENGMRSRMNGAFGCVWRFEGT